MKSVEGPKTQPLRSTIVWALVVCVAVAMAPWLSGGQEPVALLMSSGAVLLGGLLAWRQPEVRRLRGSALGWAYAAFVLWGALSLLWTANRYSTMLWLIMFGLAGVVFRLAYIVAGEEQGRQRLVAAYAVSAAVFAGYGFWLYFTSDYDRLTGSFYWANPAAAYLMPAILIGLGWLRQAGRARWWGMALVAVCGTGFALTDSRAATLVLAVVVTLYLLVQPLNKRFWITFLFSVVSVIILSGASVQVRHVLRPGAAITAPGSRFAAAASGESQSASDRLHYLGSAVNMWLAHPLLGVGAGTYGDVHPQYQGRVVSASTNAHNIYVQTLAELGLPGVVALVWALLALLVGVLRGLIREPAGGVPVALGLLALLLHSGLDIDASYPALVLLMAALAGLLYASGRLARGPVSWKLPALAVAVLVPSISLYQSDVWVQRAQVSQSNGDYATAATQYAAAHSTLLYNPDTINAEGIDLYTMAVAGVPGAKALAAEALDRAHQGERQDPDDGQHHQLEGRVLALQGNNAGAVAAFTRALQLDPYNHPDYALDLATTQWQLGRPAAAVATARAMLAQYPPAVIANRAPDTMLRPNLAGLWALIGNIGLADHNVAAARTAANQALAIDPQNLRGRALLHQVNAH